MKLLLLSVAIAVCGAPVSAQTVKAASNDAPKEKRICKRAAETGSFVKGKKVCLTRREWNSAAEKGQDVGRSMQTLISTERGN